MAPISAQNTMVFTSSNVTPRLGPSRVKIHAPNRKPIAMPTPCGEMAKLPNRWTRSRTGQPMAPSSVTAGESSEGPPGHASATACPSSNPPTTSAG